MTTRVLAPDAKRSPCSQEDLFPNRHFIEQDILATKAPGAELSVAETEDMDIGTGRGAKQAPTIVLAAQRPTERRAGREALIPAADLVIDHENCIGEGRAQAHPELVGRAPTMPSDTSGIFELASPVTSGGDRGKFGRHDAVEDVGIASASCVIVAAPFVVADNVSLRCERFDAFFPCRLHAE